MGHDLMIILALSCLALQATNSKEWTDSSSLLSLGCASHQLKHLFQDTFKLTVQSTSSSTLLLGSASQY